MTDVVGTLLVLFCLLQIKHMLADYFLQTQKMLSGRATYMHAGRAQHAGVHALGSAIAFALVGAPPLFIAVIAVVDWVAHFHIDWAKARYCEENGLGPTEARFWRAAGFDQALHQLTYIAMVWAWFEFALH